jgi:hypothetical protein
MYIVKLTRTSKIPIYFGATTKNGSGFSSIEAAPARQTFRGAVANG